MCQKQNYRAAHTWLIGVWISKSCSIQSPIKTHKKASATFFDMRHEIHVIHLEGIINNQKFENLKNIVLLAILLNVVSVMRCTLYALCHVSTTDAIVTPDILLLFAERLKSNWNCCLLLAPNMVGRIDFAFIINHSYNGRALCSNFYDISMAIRLLLSYAWSVIKIDLYPRSLPSSYNRASVLRTTLQRLWLRRIVTIERRSNRTKT